MDEESEEFIIKKLSMEDATKKFSSLTTDQEIENVRSRDLIMTIDFPKHRAFINRAFKDAVTNILDMYSPKNNLGIEYGCGGSAYLFTVIPDRFKANWKLYDANPKVVDHANNVLRNLGYENVVKLSDIYSISKIHNNVPLIMGLSSWDNCYDLNRAVSETYNALSKDGVFICIQDLFPGKHLVLEREWKRRHDNGIDNGYIEYKCYKTDEWCAVEIKSIVFGWLSTITQFLVELSDSCRRAGFKNIEWGYRDGKFIGEKLLVHKDIPDKNVFFRKDTGYEIIYDKNLQENMVCEKIKFLVLIAKK